jgi:hypothetical protein
MAPNWLGGCHHILGSSISHRDAFPWHRHFSGGAGSRDNPGRIPKPGLRLIQNRPAILPRDAIAI